MKVKKTMNHKPGSVTKSLWLFVLEFEAIRKDSQTPSYRFVEALTYCHLSWDNLSAGLFAVYPQHRRAALPLLDFAPDEVCRWHCYQYRGGLLPRLFTLTLQYGKPYYRAVYFLLHFLSLKL